MESTNGGDGRAREGRTTLARFVFSYYSDGKLYTYMESTPREDRIEEENAGSGYLGFWLRCKSEVLGVIGDGYITDLYTDEQFRI
jgi:hypothetical protein